MTEAVPTEGFWRIRVDDVTEQVVIEAPDRPAKRRGLSRSERSERAAQRAAKRATQAAERARANANSAANAALNVRVHVAQAQRLQRGESI